MADSQYPDDMHFAGLVQAATAAADEHDRHIATQNKRKHSESFPEDDYAEQELPIDPEVKGGLGEEGESTLHNSAAVLFREPSAKSRKYSRPPLGKVYASLELAPESFLRLQAAAKDFMLDPQHPERRYVVGRRMVGGNSDVAKLKLWNCVEDFLTNYGHGDQYFGRNAGDGIPGAPVRTFIWPDHSQKIIKLMMPLMRKMVTNERQRVYAAETRKPPVKDAADDTGGTDPADVNGNRSSSQTPHVQEPEYAGAHPDESIQKGIAEFGNSEHAEVAPAASEPTIILHINLLSRGTGGNRRLIPKFTSSSDESQNLKSLRKQILQRYGAADKDSEQDKLDLDTAVVKVWLPDGLVAITTDGEWSVALLSAARVEWMDKEVKVLVEAGVFENGKIPRCFLV